MNPLRHLSIVARGMRQRAVRGILGHRVRYRFPTLQCHPSVIWDYGFRDLEAISLGERVAVAPYAEIIVYKRVSHSRHEGQLTIGDDSVIGTGANIRAAGGAIRIGQRTAVTQHCVLVAANHLMQLGVPILRAQWDESRVGIDVGDNVWIGAGSILLPGVHVGDGAVIAAGSVVSRDIPPNEIWGGVPARKIKDVPGHGA